MVTYEELIKRPDLTPRALFDVLTSIAETVEHAHSAGYSCTALDGREIYVGDAVGTVFLGDLAPLPPAIAAPTRSNSPISARDLRVALDVHCLSQLGLSGARNLADDFGLSAVLRRGAVGADPQVLRTMSALRGALEQWYLQSALGNDETGWRERATTNTGEVPQVHWSLI